jgi:hypothetical protein
MLVISNKQFGRLNELYNERYEETTARYLAEKYQDWAAQPGNDINSFVSKGVKKAERFNITDSSDITAFLEYTIQLGPDFEEKEEHKWAAEILKIRNLSGPEKIGRMLDVRPLQS